MSRAVRTMSVLVAAVVLVAAMLVGCGAGKVAGGTYHCPMHPTYLSDRPGDCPICGMRLVEVKQGTKQQQAADRSPVSAARPASGAAYVCPMECPNGSSDSPGRCPDCGMKLVKAEVTGPTPAGDKAHDQHPSPARGAEDAAHAGSQVAGMAELEIEAEGVRLSGVQTAAAVRETLARSLRTVGAVGPDERRIRHVHTKMSGWVEKLFVNFTGQLVRAGEPVLAIYSPELVAGQEELLRAREVASRFAASELPEVRRGGEELLEAARRRLVLLDVPESFIEELERSGKPLREVTLLAPTSGYVTVKNVVEGHEVSPGMELFTIIDLSRVWVDAEVYEYEMGSLRIGQEAAITLPYDATVSLSGRASYIYPTLSPESRTVRVRFELLNPQMVLKPGMFANVEIALGGGEGVVIPDSAVIDTGTRQVVFVALEGDRFAPREIRVGVRNAGKVQVITGLAEGEQVVIRANFLLDSESRLRAAIAGMSGSSAHQH